ncbi:MAG: hypothetical protein ACRDQ1_14560, partial [Sciscionella sp.]
DGTTTAVPPIAPCDINGAQHAGSAQVTRNSVLEYGPATSDCTIDAGDNTTRVTTSGNNFEFDGLNRYGGPTLAMRSYSAGCDAQQSKTQGTFSLTGYYGFDLPSSIPANYTVFVPGAKQSDPPMAKLVFSEIVPPPTQDGSQTFNLLHITLFPQGGPASGDVYVGRIHCSVTGAAASPKA